MVEFSLSESGRERPGKTVQILKVAGGLDAYSFPVLQERIEQLIAGGARYLVIDCAGLDYISSAGLGVLKKMVREIRTHGGDIRLAALSEQITKIVHLLGFDKVINVYATLEDAVSSY